MKSIVLCERTLVQDSEDFGTLKKKNLNKKEKAEEKINGISDHKSETVIKSSRKAGKSDHHGSSESLQIFMEDVTESDGNKSPNEVEKGTGKDSDGTDSSVANARCNLCNNGGEKDHSVSETDSSTKDIIAEGDVQSDSGCVQELNLNTEGGISLNVKACAETSEIEKSYLKSSTNDKKINNSLENSDNVPMEKSLAFVTGQGKKERELSIVNIDLDVDENKENEKEGKRKHVDEFLGNDPLSSQSNGCEIKVGDVQSITGLEKDSIWAETDFKSPEQNPMEAAEGRHSVTDISSPDAGIPEGGNENQELETNETVPSEAEENIADMPADKEEDSHRTQELVNEENDLTDLSSNEIITAGVKIKTHQGKKENNVCRKRHIAQEEISESFVKKKRLSTEDENMEDSSRYENFASPGQTSSEAGLLTTKRKSIEDKIGKKLKPSSGDEELKAKTDLKFSILEKFRGALKTLTRADLEELIVQKLCEVITERSNVGELRRKAQALEQDQERWKTKVQSLTKQMREMEMVMKKYMTEVQKQIKEGDTHVITPLKVTRSVGLQVSFYSSANKGPKSGVSQQVVPSGPASSPNTNIRNAKGTLPKPSSHFGSPNQNVRNKPITYQKSSQTPQKAPVSQQRRSIVPKPDYVSQRAMQHSLISGSRGVQNHVSRATYKSVSGTTAMTTTTAPTTTATTATMTVSSPALQQHQQQQQKQQLQQNGSKVIDLTDDDDRQTVRSSAPIRVVNHVSQVPAPQSNRLAYLLPTTSASSATSGGQSRQVLIATPTMSQSSRQIMCSMPPLLFKGGNVIQSGTQSHVVNQSNKVMIPKYLRHPAPLPQQPVNQNTRPNLKLLPPRPALKISKVQTGIVLSWNMSLSPDHAPIASYQLYAYQESNSPPATSLWKKVGDVKALPLPMACTLTQFMSGHKYHFAVRAVDLHSRIGPFSFPGTIVLVK